MLNLCEDRVSEEIHIELGEQSLLVTAPEAELAVARSQDPTGTSKGPGSVPHER